MKKQEKTKQEKKTAQEKILEVVGKDEFNAKLVMEKLPDMKKKTVLGTIWKMRKTEVVFNIAKGKYKKK